MRNVKLFRNVVCNMILGTVVLAVLAVSISTGVVATSVGTLKPLYKGSSVQNVSLMINVERGTEYLDEILSTLEKHNVKTTFFVGGLWAINNEDALKSIHGQGHELGSRGYNQKDFRKLSEQRCREELEITHRLIKSMTDAEMGLFLPPGGSFNDTALRTASTLGYKTVMYTFDLLNITDAESALNNRALQNITGGTLVLMRADKLAADALDGVIGLITQKGLIVTTVSNTL